MTINHDDMFKDTKRVIRNPESMKDVQYSGQEKKDKHLSTKHYIEK